MPAPSDGAHAEWLDSEINKKGAANGTHFNNIEAVIRRHHGEVKVMDVPRWVRWEEETPYPAGVYWSWYESGWYYWAPRRVCFTLPEVFQYFPGTASALYLWYCHNGETVRGAERTTQSVKAAATFHARVTMEAPAKAWLKEMVAQLPLEFRRQFGRDLPSGSIPADLMTQAREQVSAAIQAALRDTANRSVNLNVYMRARPYQFPVASSDRLQWAVMHDERLTLLLSDPDLPASFRADARVV